MSFNDTVDLERSLLRSLTKSSHMCRMYVQSLRDEWFTSEEREFVCKVILETFRNSKSMLTESVFEYEVDKRIDDEERKHYLGEWNFIKGVTVADPPEALIDLLREAHLGRRMMEDIEQVILKAEAGDIEEAVSIYKRSAVSMNSGNLDHPIVELTDYKHRLEIIKDKQQFPEKYLGIRTGFETFDKRTGGLFAEELFLIAGVTGLGKSTLVKQLQHGIITKNKNKNVLHIANEESQIQVETKFDALMTEIPYLDFKLAKISDEDLDKWVDTMEVKLKKPGIGRVFVKEVPAFTDVTLIEQAYRELEAQGIKIHVIIIDHLPHVVPITKAYGENDEKSKAAADCKQLSKDLKCSVVIPTQAATVVEEKQAKGRRAGKLDVHGAKAVIHVANSFMIITDKGKVPDKNLEDWEQDVNWLCDMKKNRDGPGFCFRARHYVHFGKVVEVFDSKEQEEDEEHAANDEEAKAAADAAKDEASDEQPKDVGTPKKDKDSTEVTEGDTEVSQEPEPQKVIRKAPRSIKMPKSAKKVKKE